MVYIRVLETRSYKFKSCYSHQCGYKLAVNYYLAKVISSVRSRLSAPFAAIRQCLDFHSSKVTIWVGIPVAAPCSLNSVGRVIPLQGISRKFKSYSEYHNLRSSNGRTAGFELAYGGSSPSLRTIWVCSSVG